jgi:hypothetical protein
MLPMIYVGNRTDLATCSAHAAINADHEGMLGAGRLSMFTWPSVRRVESVPEAAECGRR